MPIYNEIAELDDFSTVSPHTREARTLHLTKPTMQMRIDIILYIAR